MCCNAQERRVKHIFGQAKKIYWLIDRGMRTLLLFSIKNYTFKKIPFEVGVEVKKIGFFFEINVQRVF